MNPAAADSAKASEKNLRRQAVVSPRRSPAPLAREIPDPRLRKSMHFHPARLHSSRTFNIAPARDENSGMTIGGAAGGDGEIRQAELGNDRKLLERPEEAEADGDDLPHRSRRRLTAENVGREIRGLERRMLRHAQNLEFEKAAELRDQIRIIRRQVLGVGA